MTTATTFFPVSGANESSKRSSVPDASVSHPTHFFLRNQQTFSHFPCCSSPQLPAQGEHGEDHISTETFSDYNSGQFSDEKNEDDLGLRDILVNQLQDNEFKNMDNDGYILRDYLPNAHYDIQDMPAFDGREEEELPTTDAGNVALYMISRVNKLHSVLIYVLLN
jgi:hypothetical protein